MCCITFCHWQEHTLCARPSLGVWSLNKIVPRCPGLVSAWVSPDECRGPLRWMAWENRNGGIRVFGPPLGALSGEREVMPGPRRQIFLNRWWNGERIVSKVIQLPTVIAGGQTQTWSMSPQLGVPLPCRSLGGVCGG